MHRGAPFTDVCFILPILVAAGLAGCGDDPAAGPSETDLVSGTPPVVETAEAIAVVESLRAMHVHDPPSLPGAAPGRPWVALGPGEAPVVDDGSALVVETVSASPDHRPIVVRAAREGTLSWDLEDPASGVAMTVTPEDLSTGHAERARDLLVWRGIAPGGGDVVLRPLADGIEDYVSFATPGAEALSYRLDLRGGAVGLRLVDDVLEILDASPSPRLRMRAPSVVGADGVAARARVEVSGCAVDRDPADPWSRPPTAPGARSCRVTVRWEGAGLQYPVLFDPGWSSTASMASARADHGLQVYGSGASQRVLAAGGISGASFVSAAETYNRNAAPPAWAAVNAMPEAKAGFVLANAGSSTEEPHAIGGVRAAAPTVTDTNYRFNTGAGTWTTRTAIPTRVAYAAGVAYGALFPITTIFVAGGTTTSPSVAVTSAFQRFSSSGNSWTAMDALNTARYRHAIWLEGFATATIHVAGGSNNSTALSAAEWINTDAGSPNWTNLPSMPVAITNAVHTGTHVAGDGTQTARWSGSSWTGTDLVGESMVEPAAALVFPAGRDILVGGATTGTYKWAGATLGWLNAGGLPGPISCQLPPPCIFGQRASAVTLGSGEVLVAGGMATSGTMTNRAWLFTEQAQGAACSVGAPGACSSNFCADGFCCNTACTGLCQGCSSAVKGQGSNGVCGPVVAGTDPDANCVDDGAASCDQNGLCDGAGACQIYASGTACNTAACSNGGITTYACNGSGTCNATNGTCGGYACASASACRTTCSSDSHCVSTHWCSGTACVVKLAQGATCTGGNQCASTFCVDGRCCNIACGSLCNACSATKKGAGGGPDGECGPIGAGLDPDGDCAVGAACMEDGTCNGSGGCRLQLAGTPCGSTMCVGNSVTGQTCNGSGSCLNMPGGTDCAPFLCTGGACADPCASDAHCVGGAFCDAGVCRYKLANGQTCTGANQCTSTNCIDGFCCNTACSGLCQACSAAKKGAGANGDCGNVVSGQDPDDDCSVVGQCGNDGTCNGTGACRLRASGGACGSPVCVGNSLTPQQCDGLGSCVNGPSGTTCAPYVCTSGACSQPCATDANCVNGYFCDAGACTPRFPNGTVCSAANQCVSGFCSDGVCCNAQCSGLCQACTLAKKGVGVDGDCGTINSGLDPDDECAVGAQCGQDGACNGAGACRLTAAGIPCGATTCVGNLATGQICNGSGACVNDAVGVNCSPHLCTGGACANPCANDTQCVSGYFCNAGTCALLFADGTACGTGDQCQSGFCVDGVCCDSQCSGLCQACSASRKGAGNDGECGPIGAALDPDNECAVGAQCGTDGACDGAGGCRLQVAGTACGNTQCVGNRATGQICNGLGACVNDATGVDCAPHACTSGACANPCATDAHCVAGNFCASGACLGAKATGAACGGANECASGHCVDGVCCDSPCGGSCQACAAALKESGADGACGPAKAGTDPRDDCTEDGASTCQRDGSCDGAGACRLYPGGVACGASSCVGNDVVGRICNGLGTCINETAGRPCAPYLCTPGGCATSCQNDAECIGDTFCDASTCTPLLANGTACDDASDCSSGFCVDRVCCETNCTGQCEACDVAGSEGTCSAVTGPPHGARPPCTVGTSAECLGQCDGSNRAVCVYPGTSTLCGATACDGNVFKPYRCDGLGGCQQATTVDCGAYACDSAAKSCKTSCTTDGDCASGAVCNTGAGQCAQAGATCIDDHTLRNPDGTEEDCEPYRCSGTSCRDGCTISEECATGFVCDGTECKPSDPTGASSGDEGGCGCRAPRGRGTAPWALLVALAALARMGAGARRRKGARRRGRPGRGCTAGPDGPMLT